MIKGPTSATSNTVTSQKILVSVLKGSVLLSHTDTKKKGKKKRQRLKKKGGGRGERNIAFLRCSSIHNSLAKREYYI